ncbi:MAG TPA: lipopolysaccharide biosynthesis protein [Gemmatimonadales bacterium]|jgi:O-antigen/teichoic acid export membrane protein|nr:lipopolysaccharide biosynthesis protein [Gemmatimonadales bacterium]
MSAGKSRLRLPAPFYYYVSFAALPLLGLAQTRVLTALLSQSAFGSLQLVTPIIRWCVVIGGLGTPQFIVRFYSRDGGAVLWESLSLSLAATAAVSLVLGGLAIAVDPRVADIRPGALLAVLLIAALFAGQFAALIKALLRVQERHLRYNMVVVLERVGILAGVALAVWWWPRSPIEAFLIGSTIGTAAVVLPIAARRRRSWRKAASAPEPHRLREILTFGGPIVGVMLLGEMYATLNRYVIGLAGMGTTLIARYVIGYTVATLGLQALYEPLVTYIHPRIFQAWERNGPAEAHRILGRYLLIYTLVGALTAAAFYLAEPWLIPLIAGSAYRVEPRVFAALLASSFLLGVYRLLSTHYYLAGRTGELALSYFVALLLNLLGAALLVRESGLFGVAMASAVSAGVLCLLVFWRASSLTEIARATVAT